MKLTGWRIVKTQYAATAFSGEGAFRIGGRWNSWGGRIVYTSGSLSLAALELLVHLDPPIHLRWSAIRCEFDEELVTTLDRDELPFDWARYPAPLSTQRVGDRWISGMKSAVLALPSVIVPGEPNYLLNPGHPDFSRIRIHPPERFAFDPRLLP